MTRAELLSQILQKRSYLCTGLDTQIEKLPQGISRDLRGMVEFNQRIVEATADHSVAYKINTAFYEQYGAAGWSAMEETLSHLPSNTFRIADAKRGDIGNTSSMYAKAFFDTLPFDAVTVAPYMGEDSLRPFLEFPNKWVICLALTSNAGHADFQLGDYEGKKLYERVIETVCKWGNPDQLMFVVGATRASLVSDIRALIPEHYLLVPGVGAQGGSLHDISKAGFIAGAQESAAADVAVAASTTAEADGPAAAGGTVNPGMLVNSSRGILYASSGEDFAQAARREAAALAAEMDELLK